jgi:hypothetical protein
MQFARNLLNEQRRRLVGNLMTYIESNVYRHLSEHEQRELRKRVLTAVGAYHDVCVDMLKASIDDGSIVNEDAVRLMARLSSQMEILRSELTHGQ